MGRLFATVVMIFCASAAFADARNALVDRYFDLFKMTEVFDILKQEGISASMEAATEDDAISVSPAWRARLEQIYAIDKMDAIFRAAVRDAEISGSSDALDFFNSELGQRIVDVELEARRALMEDGVEEAMLDQVEHMETSEADRLALYREFVTANGLIENNVMGALNSNLAFYRGLATGEAYADTMSESFMLTTVWEQEPEIRADMEEWTMSFSVLAYAPLSDEEMQAYIDISETQSGQRLNSVLFQGFDALFEMQSFELGRAMAEFMVGEDT